MDVAGKARVVVVVPPLHSCSHGRQNDVLVVYHRWRDVCQVITN